MKTRRSTFSTAAAPSVIVIILLVLCSCSLLTQKNALAVVVVAAFVPSAPNVFRHDGSSTLLSLPTESAPMRPLSTTLHASLLPPPPPPPPPPPDASVLDSVIKQVTTVADKLEVSKLTSGLDGDNFKIDSSALDSITKQVTAAIENLELSKLISDLDGDNVQIAQLSEMVQEFQTNVLQEYPALQPVYEKLSALAAPLLQQSPTMAGIVTGLVTTGVLITSLVLSNTASARQKDDAVEPYPQKRYDPVAARAYFSKRLPVVVVRGLEILLKSLSFGVLLLKDTIDGKMAENGELRGEQLAKLLTELGPTFIKVGQSLSIRTDLLSPAYARGLATLQDQVPSFDNEAAVAILEQEWGCRVEEVIEYLPDKPIAAASLGQVYKTRLLSTGQDVAIKVQRPDITTQIALDMYLLREFAGPAKQIFNLNTNTTGTVDVWGAGFVDELDYLQEATNAGIFSEKITKTPLSDVVFAPAVVDDYTTGKVLVTEWVDGVRLDESDSADVTAVCSIAMNTYLTMMLDLGLLHCDPHPGNLLLVKSTDQQKNGDEKGIGSRLAILDWGMTTSLDPKIQLILIEHMAHLVSADYDEIPRDLLLLDFIPEEKADLIEDSGIVELLANIYGQWKSGGGAKSVNVNDVMVKVQDLTAEKGNFFQIPPYFAYIAKSFSVLEGIGLSNDEKYSIVNECLPYVSRRLLTDKEAMGPALSTFIFGPTKNDPDRVVDYKRVKQLVEGFGDYETSASGALLGKEDLSRTELLESAADQILDLVLTDEETPLQEILLEQTAKVISASSRSIWETVRESSGKLPSGRTVLGTLVDPLGLWRTSPLVRSSDKDKKIVETTIKLLDLVRNELGENSNPIFDVSQISSSEAAQLSNALAQMLWKRRWQIVQSGNRLAQKLIRITADQLDSDSSRVDRLLMPSTTEETVDHQITLPSTTEEEASKQLYPVEHAEKGKISLSSSPRLLDARKRLEALQQ